MTPTDSMINNCNRNMQPKISQTASEPVDEEIIMENVHAGPIQQVNSMEPNEVEEHYEPPVIAVGGIQSLT